MKKMFFNMLMVITVIAVTNTNTMATSKYSAFLKGKYLSTLNNEGTYREALKDLFFGKGEKWNDGAKDAYLSDVIKKFGPVDLNTLIDGTVFKTPPSNFFETYELARLSKSDGSVSWWARLARDNELVGYYQGKPWTSTDCGNGVRKKVAKVTAQTDIEEDDDDYSQPPTPQHHVVQQQQQQQQQPPPAPIQQQQQQVVQAPPQVQYVYLQAPQQQVVQQPVQQYQPAPQPVMYQQPQQSVEQTISIRPNATDWINTGMNVANTVFGAFNTFRGIRIEGQNQQYYGQQYCAQQNVQQTNWGQGGYNQGGYYQQPYRISNGGGYYQNPAFQGASGAYQNPNTGYTPVTWTNPGTGYTVDPNHRY